MSAHPKPIEPSNIFRQVAPGRATNASLRTREYVTPAEAEKLAKAARSGRYGHRDATLILIAFRHGLRANRDMRLGVEPGRIQPIGPSACPAS